MGSRKKKDDSESSSTSSDSSSESSDSTTEKRSNRKNKKHSRKNDSDVDSESTKKASKKENLKLKSRDLEADSHVNKSKTNKREQSLEEERKRRRTESLDNKESRDRDRERERKTRDDRRVKENYDRHEAGRSRHNEYDRPQGERYRNRRADFRDRDPRRDDRNRDYRNRRDDDRHYNNRDRDRNRNNRDNYQRRRSRSPSFDHSNAKWGRDQGGNKKDEKDEKKDKQKPNFALSGKLTEETNTYRGVVIKYSEPPEARKPKRRWRLYPFKGEKALQTLYIHRESAYLIGRDRKVVDLPIDHPSCSKQHAALQYRLVPFTRDDGSAGKRVRPYLIDLNSANGTHINNKRIESSKYVELLEKDVIKFGFSSREYVLLHENSKDEAQDDDVKIEEEVTVKNEDE